MAIEPDQLFWIDAGDIEIPIALGQPVDVERVADQRRVVAVAAAEIQDLDRPLADFLQRRDRVAKDPLGNIGNNIVETVKYSIVIPRIWLEVNILEVSFEIVHRLKCERLLLNHRSRDLRKFESHDTNCSHAAAGSAH